MRSHFVPRFLLKQWARDKRYIFEYRLEHKGEAVRTSTKATGFRMDLLALADPTLSNDQRQEVETEFTKPIDDAAARIRARLASSGRSTLSENEEVAWAVLLNSLRGRQPNFLDKHVKGGTAHDVLGEALGIPYSAIRDLAAKPGEAQALRALLGGHFEDFGIQPWKDAVHDPRLVGRICALEWRVIDLDHSRWELLLSDNPLISVNDQQTPQWAMALPLSPRRLFMAHRGIDMDAFLARHSKSEFVARVNESSIFQATRWVYGTNDSHMRFVEKRLRQIGQGRSITSA